MIDLTDLAYDFHDAILFEVWIGPRREVTLLLELWPRPQVAWQPGTGRGVVIELRFGAIENFVAVRSFLRTFFQVLHPSVRSRPLEGDPQADAGLERLPFAVSLDLLRYDPSRSSRSGRVFIEIDFDGWPDRLNIECRNVRLSERSSGDA
jgi:hypothetical protein